ncbi:MAG: DUF6326 family protein [Cyclobacteriaceae bacterium]|nr:DUF6326 family protein [Cyclobacteriaceae bacterium]
MTTQTIPQNSLQEIKTSLKLKLAALWTSVMFIIIYLDYFHLYMPDKIGDIQNGRVFVFDITQEFLLVALALVTLPALMISLSVILPAKVNRWANIIAAAINIPLILFNLAGEAWIHMVIGAIIQFILLCLIIVYAWKWPRTES